MPLTQQQKTNLMDILALIGERDMPSNNTETRLVQRSGLDEDIVAWCLAVLWNEGEGWLEWDDHPKTGERGYYLGERFDAASGSLNTIYRKFCNRPKKAGDIDLNVDDEDPDDEWVDVDVDHR